MNATEPVNKPILQQVVAKSSMPHETMLRLQKPNAQGGRAVSALAQRRDAVATLHARAFWKALIAVFKLCRELCRELCRFKNSAFCRHCQLPLPTADCYCGTTSLCASAPLREITMPESLKGAA